MGLNETKYVGSLGLTPSLFVYFAVNRDMYGFEVRPQHLERYLEYAAIYKVLSLSWFFVHSSSSNPAVLMFVDVI
jgi:hypothetical protein